MKQMRSILAPLLMLLTGVLMTSCDDEQETAMMLWGTWEGQLSTEFYQDRWGGYGQTYYTVWHFEGKPGSRHGKGWEIDYVGHQRYAQHFDWQVIDDGRTVRLHYAGHGTTSGSTTSISTTATSRATSTVETASSRSSNWSA